MELCTCPEVPALPPHLLEFTESYGVVSNTAPNTLFPHNVLSTRAILRACGRLHCTSHAPASPPCAHPPGEVALCAALSGAVARLLAPYCVSRGDEGDHRWREFSLPVAVPVDVAPGVVTGGELLAAACGALWQDLKFVATPALDVAMEMDAREGEEATQEGEAWRAAVAALEEGGATGATYLRPREGVGFGPSVWPHFFLARTPAGSLAGVVGATVWT
jgi:hypothetical protein